MNETRAGGADILTLLGLSLIWGTSYVLIKWGLEVFSPLQVASMRLGIAALALAPLAWVHLRKVRRSQIPLLLLIGLTGTGLPSFLFPYAQTELSSSLTGMLSGLTPLCTFLLAWLFFRGKPTLIQFGGILLGLVGAVLLAYLAPGEGGQTTRLGYAGFILAACFCYGLSSNLVANYFREVSPLTITVGSFFLVGAPALVWGVVWGDIVPTAARTHGGWEALGYVSILALLSTVLASIVFFKLVQRTGAVFASTVSYLIPLVALAWGLLDGERFGTYQLPAAAMILVGIGLSRRK